MAYIKSRIRVQSEKMIRVRVQSEKMNLII